ncbi:glycoside hydrolase family 26 protein [Teredinibacter haidensis]|uniref:glycoside hydrolase family 26 protein n=1 Tax=Teredinibacter haidensis TaxID=2731755 RepID=UPI0009F97F99|nr:glycosyl hydrolase [Teredinibacter haidensis]
MIRQLIRSLACVSTYIMLTSCGGQVAETSGIMGAPSLVTENSTAQTQALYRNLATVGKTQVLFGHQNTTAYGVNWINEEGRSDVKDVTGSNPAVFGWDLAHLESGDEKSLDNISFDFIRDQIKASYQRGAINTLSWHMRDPVTGGSSWDKNPTVAKLIPGGEAHDKLKANLDTFVAFNETLKVKNADGKMEYVPIIFRPWHEHNGDWFWWGKGENLTSEEDYIALWRFTVDYLRDEKGLRNLIYAFSPDRSRMDLSLLPESYLYAYPGDNYVDIIGLDNYWDLGHPYNNEPLEARRGYFVASLEAISDIAKAKNKVAALTEGGQETVHQDKFWTDMILSNVLATESSANIAYLLVWRNANKARENRDHFYAPYKGHKSEQDFIDFYNHPATVFESNLPNMYE